MDRLAGELIGLPVVTLDGGSKLAKVEDMIVDPARRQVLALVVQEKVLGRPARAIPFGRLTASGPDALVVQNSKVTLDVDRDPVLKGLDNGQRVQGAEVMTDDGRRIGTVRDMLIDDRTGEIKAYSVARGDGDALRSIPSDSVVSMGKEILYVSAAAAERVAPTAALALEEGDAARVTVRRKGVKDETESSQSAAAEEPAGIHAGTATPSSPVDKLVNETMAATSGLANMMGGTIVNTRLLFGIVILVLGILILVYPALLPLIAGIALIVIGLWVALQNASGARP
jgi:uncharacterized protein YrrD